MTLQRQGLPPSIGVRGSQLGCVLDRRLRLRIEMQTTMLRRRRR